MQGAPMVVNEGDDGIMGLPPGFRFHPTDEEIITHYLTPKVMNRNFSACAIGEVDLNKCEPWDLPKKAKMGEKEWFFFCQRDRKYPTGMRTNRATESGYWKATGKDKEIFRYGKSGNLVGMKKTLVFYKGRAPKGEKTNWVMHEFRLEGKFSYYNLPKSSKDEWVVCRVFHKSSGMKRSPITDNGTRMNAIMDELLDSPPWLPPLMDSPPILDDNPSSSYINDNNDYNNDNSGLNDKFKSNLSAGNYLSSNFSSSLMNNIHDQSQMQRDHEYKPTLVSPYNYNFNTNTYQASPFVNDQILMQPNNPYSQISASNFPYQPPGSSLSPLGYSQHERMISTLKPSNLEKGNDVNNVIRQCNVENSKISASQETGVSTDMTAEISSSSMVSKQDNMDMSGSRSYDHPDRSALLSDLDSLLEF